MQSNQPVVNICLGTDPQLFRFNPRKVHDLYVILNTIWIELIVDDQFIADYQFEYTDTDDMLADLKCLSDAISSYK